MTTDAEQRDAKADQQRYERLTDEAKDRLLRSLKAAQDFQRDTRGGRR